MINPVENPVAFTLIFLLVPFVHEVGFYFAHRFLHWPPSTELRIRFIIEQTRTLVWTFYASNRTRDLFFLCPDLLCYTCTPSI